ncbi:TfuA-like protein [Sphingosinicella humi]|uniref:TfuA-like core domain-containing protein n=1 Tax=Allosphingosinicella humi TaxID=2068657 RepID=A0A2U2J0Q7_9SPHN|nr:TfuA-like protein [Sphingosinicella humi]PWG01897.1 hypothetical protein DF286_02680 [Sphingosinicella humi]
MTIIAFAGPSLTEEDRREFSGVTWMPPAEAGDLLRLDVNASTRLCLIDGYFDHRPAVRHKEILLLLSEGIRIFGASSIGALRAAEMDGFGLIGVGAIYRAYARGNLVGDDEVALVHGPEDWDWRPLSVPLVDVRATLCRARRRGLIDAEEARALLQAAASIHYIDRTWSLVVQLASLPRQHPPLESSLKQWAVEQKRLDARECLRMAAGEVPALRRPAMVRTVFLDNLALECGVDLDRRCLAGTADGRVTDDPIKVNKRQ